ncbi:MAG: TIGR03905 family TSCPD domain-containing protein [Lachnospiraceae bacterium]|nr:TIGR03905 family TSCPD domain-containing protein [Lachnospiraceae bacterium]
MLYRTKGTCSQAINVEAEDGVIKFVEFVGGCNGNTKGIAKLVTGMKVDDVIELLEGTTCGYKPTSCPDQLAQALKQLKSEQA